MKMSSLFPLFVLLLCLAASTQAEDGSATPSPRLQPSFPNYALVMTPAAATARENPAGPVDDEPTFSWPQTVVLHEGTANLRRIGAFDPGLQSVQFNILTKSPAIMDVTAFDGETGWIQATAPAKSGGLSETLLYQVQARGLAPNDVFGLTYDIRASNTRVRGTPIVSRSPGVYIRPGQIVRYAWTFTGRGEKRPKDEAEIFGRTGTAAGIYSSTVTGVLSVKFQPFVLGHYLLTVTPRDVRGEPPRGSTSNGQVFRCAFGSENLPPATDGFSADTFTPAVGQVVTMSPFAIDPETGRSVFDNQTYDFGDGTIVGGISGAATHAYAQPGIYRVRCTMMDDAGLAATAEDTIVVGATILPKLAFKFTKQIVPEEAGIGALADDNFAATFAGANAQPGDRIVFSFNRNRFGRMNASDGGDTDIVLKGGFSGPADGAKHVSVSGGKNVSVSVSAVQLDRTGDPRFGRADLKGVFRNQRIAVCVVPASGAAPRVLLYTGNIELKVKGGAENRTVFVPEENVHGTATLKEPNPKKQEIP